MEVDGLMKVKYLGETSPLELIHDKVYEVLSIEGEWYRIVDETDEDYLYPPPRTSRLSSPMMAPYR